MERPTASVSVDDQDDFGFAFIARNIAINVWERSGAPALRIVKIDSWFGPRWHQFAEKVLGLAGVHGVRPLPVPPFNPNRVQSCWTFRSRGYEPTGKRPTLHAWINSESNFRRYFSDISPDAPAVWFSGNTRANGRGSIMVYARERLDTYAWYAGWLKTNDTWLPTQLRAISPSELRNLAAYPSASFNGAPDC